MIMKVFEGAVIVSQFRSISSDIMSPMKETSAGQGGEPVSIIDWIDMYAVSSSHSVIDVVRA
jgi:hypothetical protein